MSFPLNISFYPTFLCAENCKFCFVDDKIKTIDTTMELIDWEKIVDESVRRGAASLSILGGEPTLYKDIVPLIDYINKSKVSATITTNGQNIKPEIKEILLASDCVTTCFSLQLINEKHEYLTGNRCDNVLDNISHFSKSGVSFGINTVFTIQSYDDILGIADMCVNLDVPIFTLSLYVPKNGRIETNYRISDVRNLHERINDYIISRGVRTRFSVEGCMYFSTFYEDACLEDSNRKICTNEYNYYDLFENVNHGCDNGNGKLEIGCDGFAYPCCVYMGSDNKDRLSNYGSIKQLRDKSVVLSKFRNLKELSVQECKGCLFSGFCKGGCPYLITENKKVIGRDREDRCEITIQK